MGCTQGHVYVHTRELGAQGRTFSGSLKGVRPPVEFGEWTRDCSLGHVGKEGPHLTMTGASRARPQQYVNHELPHVQAGFRKGRGTRNQIANIHWIIEKAKEFQKTSTSLLTMPKPLTVWITTNCGQFFKRWEYQTS